MRWIIILIFISLQGFAQLPQIPIQVFETGLENELARLEGRSARTDPWPTLPKLATGTISDNIRQRLIDVGAVADSLTADASGLTQLSAAAIDTGLNILQRVVALEASTDTTFVFPQAFTWTGDDPDGWTVFVSGGESATNRVTENPTGVFQLESTGPLVYAHIDALEPSTDYEMILYVRSVTAGDVKVWATDGSSSTVGIHTGNETGAIHKFFTTGVNDTLLEIKRSFGATEFQIDSVKVFEQIGTPPTEDGDIDIFVSVSGDGTGDGSEGDPYNMAQAITALENSTIQTIGFKRGDVFTMTDSVVTTQTNGDTLLAYGTGPKPIIRGGQDIHGDTWTEESTDLWYADVSSYGEVFNVHLDGWQGVYASYPADTVGFLEIGTVTDQNTFQILGYNKSTNPDIDGATLFAREEYWESERRTVTAVASGSNPVIDVSSNYGGPITEGGSVKAFGLKVFLEATTNGMWWYDSGNSRLYLTSDNNPNTDYSEIIITTNEHFFMHLDGADNYIVSDLEVSHFQMSAFYIDGGSNGNTIDSCEIANNKWVGIYQNADDNTTITNNHIHHSNSFGVWGDSDYDNTIATGNTMHDIGTRPYYGHFNDFIGDIAQGGFFYNHGTGDNAQIKDNIISRTGYAAILWKGSIVEISGNVIDSACLNVADMSGIYAYGGTDGSTSDNITVARNRITNQVGRNLKDDDDRLATYSIYMDGTINVGTNRIDSNYAHTTHGEGVLFIQSGANGWLIRGDTLIMEEGSDTGNSELQYVTMLRNRNASYISQNIVIENCYMEMRGDDTDDMIFRVDDNQSSPNYPTDVFGLSGNSNFNTYRVDDAGHWFMRPNGLTKTITDWRADTPYDDGSTFTVF